MENLFLNMVMTHPSLSPQLGDITGIEGQGGKDMCQGGKLSYTVMYVALRMIM